MSRSSEGFSVIFALKMAQMADRPDLLWMNHEVEAYPDDDPTNIRHLSVRVFRPHFNDIVAECWVHKDDSTWRYGSVRIGHCTEVGTVYFHDPEQFFEYDFEHGMLEVRAVPVEVIETAEGFLARALEKTLNSTPSARDRRDQLPYAKGSSENEAVGALICANQKLFQVVIRRAKKEG